jgi:hypothetical protein
LLSRQRASIIYSVVSSNLTDEVPALGPRRLRPGGHFAYRELIAMSGETTAIPDPERTVHLQLRRFAGCPICSLHLRSLVRAADEIEAAGIREVIVFHSTEEELRRYAPEIPFALVADPRRCLYRDLGVEPSSRSLLDPRAWGAMLRGPLAALGAALRHRAPPPPLSPTGGRLGLPADFLIAPDGRLLAVKYGRHAYDQWPLEEVLRLAGRGRRSSPIPA